MALRLAVDDPTLEATLAPLAMSEFSFPHLLVTDRPEPDSLSECRLLALSRDRWRALCAAETTATDTAKFDHILVYDDPHFVRQRVERTLLRFWKLQGHDPEAFGVAPLLEPGFATRVFPHRIYDRRPIQSRAHKVRALEDLVEFVESLRASLPNFSSHFVSFAIEVQEELLCNAIWNANPSMRQSPRDGDFGLPDGEEILLEWGFDGQSMAIAVTDTFGSFPEELIPRYFKALFETEAKQRREMREDGPGAGLGLYMLMQRATVLSLTLEPGKRTEVAAIMNFAQGARGLMRGTHSIQYFRLNPGAGDGTRQEK